jgi:hypothetical protein
MAQNDLPSDDKHRLNPERPRAERGRAPATPSADMQAEDAGTAASGADRGSPTEPAMKQTSKTPAEGAK